MPYAWTVLTLLLLAQSAAESPDNPVYRTIMADGLTVNGTTVKLPAPTLPDGLSADASRAALKEVAGDDRAVQELLRDSVTAPFILKTRDVKTGDSIIRVIDLWFVVHARLDEVDLDQTLRQNGDQSVEAGNMKFASKILSENDLRERKIQPLASVGGRNEWFTHLNGRLLDRIEVQTTDRAVATRTPNSLLIAARTDVAFDADSTFPNRWTALTQQGAIEKAGSPKTYGGSLSYVKITSFPGEADALFVESHLAFVEPLDWFQGNPILRSKFGVIAQDQIRRLRREIQKKRSEPKKSASIKNPSVPNRQFRQSGASLSAATRPIG
jgi:hypothetical protein